MNKKHYVEEWVEGNRRYLYSNCPGCDANTLFSADANRPVQTASGLQAINPKFTVELDT